MAKEENTQAAVGVNLKPAAAVADTSSLSEAKETAVDNSEAAEAKKPGDAATVTSTTTTTANGMLGEQNEEVVIKLKWNTPEQLVHFILHNMKDIDENVVKEIAPLLLENGFVNKASLLAASWDGLKESGIKPGPRGLIMKWQSAAMQPSAESVWHHLVPFMLKNSIPTLPYIDEMPKERGRKHKREELLEIGIREKEGPFAGKRRRILAARRNPVTVKSPTREQFFYQGNEDSKLFIRQCTLDCFEIMWNTVKEQKEEWDLEGRMRQVAFIITGPPGLGKSWSSNTFVWRLMRERQNIWFHSASDHTLTTVGFKDGDDEPIITERTANDVILYHPPKGTWFLYDSVGGSTNTSGMIAFQEQPTGVPCVIFSSPKDSNYKVGIKKMRTGMVRELWTPSWEWQELKAVMPALYQEFGGRKSSKEEFEKFLRSLYDLWGGIPRRLAEYCSSFRQYGQEKALETSASEFQSCMNTLSMEIVSRGPAGYHDILDEVGQRGESESSSKKSAPPSWLVFPVPIDSDKFPYTSKTHRFCSHRAEVDFLLHLEQQEADAVRKFCKQVFAVPGAAGIAFERFAHFVLTRTEQNKFRWKQYDNNGDCSPLTLPKCKNQECEMEKDLNEFKAVIAECIRDGKCVVIDPKSDQQDAIDMFFVVKLDSSWLVLAMQDTISKTHSFHPVKILEYRAAAQAAFESQGIDVSDDFFRHVVVVPQESPNNPFRLEGATMSKLASVKAVNVKCKEIKLQPVVVEANWKSSAAKAACAGAKLKNYTKLKGDELLTAGAEVLLLKEAGKKVTELTWVLDGFSNR